MHALEPDGAREMKTKKYPSNSIYEYQFVAMRLYVSKTSE